MGSGQGDARNYRTRRLLLNLESPSLESSGIKQDYEKAVAIWNDSFNSFCVRLTLLSSSRYSSRLEGDIQLNFYDLSERLGILLRGGRVIDRKAKASLNRDLDLQNARLVNFSRDLMRLLLAKQKETYDGVLMDFTKSTFDQFSTWYLLKALFQAKHPPLTIRGSSPHSYKPSFRRF